MYASSFLSDSTYCIVKPCFQSTSNMGDFSIYAPYEDFTNQPCLGIELNVNMQGPIPGPNQPMGPYSSLLTSDPVGPNNQTAQWLTNYMTSDFEFLDDYRAFINTQPATHSNRVQNIIYHKNVNSPNKNLQNHFGWIENYFPEIESQFQEIKHEANTISGWCGTLPLNNEVFNFPAKTPNICNYETSHPTQSVDTAFLNQPVLDHHSFREESNLHLLTEDHAGEEISTSAQEEISTSVEAQVLSNLSIDEIVRDSSSSDDSLFEIFNCDEIEFNPEETEVINEVLNIYPKQMLPPISTGFQLSSNKLLEIPKDTILSQFMGCDNHINFMPEQITEQAPNKDITPTKQDRGWSPKEIKIEEEPSASVTVTSYGNHINFTPQQITQQAPDKDVTPTKRGRGRPPKDPSTITPVTSYGDKEEQRLKNNMASKKSRDNNKKFRKEQEQKLHDLIRRNKILGDIKAGLKDAVEISKRIKITRSAEPKQ